MNERIRKLRRAMKMSQLQLAKECGHKYNSIVAGWETGRRKVNLEDLPTLARVLGTTIDYLVTGEEPRA